MDRGAWRATVYGVAKSQTRLSIFVVVQLLLNNNNNSRALYFFFFTSQSLVAPIPFRNNSSLCSTFRFKLLCDFFFPNWNLTVIWKVKESESEVAQSCPTLWDPVDCSPPGSSVHGILQARVLEWVAMGHEKELVPVCKDQASKYLHNTWQMQKKIMELFPLLNQVVLRC